MNTKNKQPHLPGTEIAPPNEIAGLTYVEKIDYAKMHGLSSEATDVGFKYRLADTVKADIFVYAYPDEESNHAANAVDLVDHYFNCVNEVLLSEGNYRTYARLTEQQLLQVHDYPYLAAWFALQDEHDNDPLYSMLALTAVGGYFLKIRYSARLIDQDVASSQDGLAEKMLDFLSELTSHLGKSNGDQAEL